MAADSLASPVQSISGSNTGVGILSAPWADAPRFSQGEGTTSSMRAMNHFSVQQYEFSPHGSVVNGRANAPLLPKKDHHGTFQST
jgi:hypothetical protein